MKTSPSILVLAVALATGAACGSDASGGMVVTVDKIPAGTSALHVELVIDDHETEEHFADNSSAELAMGGSATFAIAVPTFARDSVVVKVRALAEDCAVAVGETSCDIPNCAALRLELSDLDAPDCAESPDAGVDPQIDANDGRD